MMEWVAAVKRAYEQAGERGEIDSTPVCRPEREDFPQPGDNRASCVALDIPKDPEGLSSR